MMIFRFVAHKGQLKLTHAHGFHRKQKRIFHNARNLLVLQILCAKSVQTTMHGANARTARTAHIAFDLQATVINEFRLD